MNLIQNFVLLQIFLLKSCGCSIKEAYPPFAPGDGHLVHHLPPGDDTASYVAFNETLKFGGKTYRSLYINQNGIITFRRAVASTVTPLCNYRGSTPIIAPFWADVQTSDGLGGDISFYQSRNRRLLTKITSQIELRFYEEILLKWMFVTTWHNVTYYGANRCLLPLSRRPRNTFQTVIAVDVFGRSYALFYYHEITWLAGTGNRGSACEGLHGRPAKIGFNLGANKQPFLHIPGSCSPEVVEVDRHNVPYVYRIDGEEIALINCGHQPIVRPQFVDMYGHIPLQISGPCFNQTHYQKNITCVFSTKQTSRAILQNFGSVPTVTCLAPYFYETGDVSVKIVIGEVVYPEAHFQVYVQPGKVQVNHISSDGQFELSWNPLAFPQGTSAVINIELIPFDHEENVWSQEDSLPIIINLPNTGRFRSDSETASLLSVPSERNAKSFVTFKLTLIDNDEEKMALFTEPFCGSFFFSGKGSSELCDQWHSSLDESVIQPPHQNACPATPCPPLLNLARNDPDFRDEGLSQSVFNLLHPGAVASYVSSFQQCVYGPKGSLLTGPASGGNVRRAVPKSNRITYWKMDALPRCWCCLSHGEDFYRTCGQFYERRPSNLGFGYFEDDLPTHQALAYGFSHITTFDNKTFTLNEQGVGDYLLVTSSSLSIQAKIQRHFNFSEGNVFSAFVLKDRSNNLLEIQLPKFCDVSENIVETRFNGRRLAEVLEGQLGHFLVTASPLTREHVLVDLLDIGLKLQFSVNYCAMSALVTKRKNFFVSGNGEIGGLLFNNKANKPVHLKRRDGLSRSLAESKIDSEKLYIRKCEYQGLDRDTLTSGSGNGNGEGVVEDEAEVRQICGLSKQCLYDVCILNGKFLDFANHTAKQATAPKRATVVDVTICPSLNEQLSSFENGYFEATNASFVGSSVTFYCNSNYKLNAGGTSAELVETIQCLSNGRWNTKDGNFVVPICVDKMIEQEQFLIASVPVAESSKKQSRPFKEICWCCDSAVKNETILCCTTPKCNGPPSRMMCENFKSSYCEMLSAWEMAKPLCKKAVYPCDRSKYDDAEKITRPQYYTSSRSRKQQK